MSAVEMRPTSEPPSRRDNPFATCWTRPGAIPFRFSCGQSAEQLLSRLAAQNWRGAIIGPHGSGKTTLLSALTTTLKAAGHDVLSVTLRDGQLRFPAEFYAALNAGKSERIRVAIVDGYEQLSWWERRRLAQRCRRANLGLIVTAHSPIRIPTLIELAPDRALITQLVADLCVEVSTPIGAELVAASHASHGSNVREIFFDLYDRYERARRVSRTRVTTRA
ncbi:MAG TPA: hypothetical protein VHU84_07805 [Lacipirellulaceae bacterium]|jgi:energy-coupling factor transporter ATP-binding protein EcfA2|nr:hypothetical protein [Lacipirellulaceae bacterium]